MCLLGALAVALHDGFEGAMEGEGRWSMSAAAALNILTSARELSIDGLAAEIGLSQSATVRLVDRLAGDGLVERQPSGAGRRLRLVLTPAGRLVARRAQRDRSRFLAQLVEQLEPAEREQLVALARRLLALAIDDVADSRRVCRLCEQPACLRRGCPLPC